MRRSRRCCWKKPTKRSRLWRKRAQADPQTLPVNAQRGALDGELLEETQEQSDGNGQQHQGSGWRRPMVGQPGRALPQAGPLQR